LATALALAQKGRSVQVIEQAAEFKEVGAGIQLGPNVFRMFELLGLTEAVTRFAVFPENLIMLDAITGDEVTRVPLGADFRARFKYPYALIYRPDLLTCCWRRAATTIASGSTPRRRSLPSSSTTTASRRGPSAAPPIPGPR